MLALEKNPKSNLSTYCPLPFWVPNRVSWKDKRVRPQTQQQAFRRLPAPAHLIAVSKLTEMFYFYVSQKHLYIPRYHFKTAIYFSCTHPCRIVILMAQQSKVTQETEVGAVEVSSLSRPWVPGTMGYIIKHCIKKYTFKNYPNLAISYKLLPW